MTFLGLLVMENRLKPETTPIIRQLKEAAIRTVMVTGQSNSYNIMCACSVLLFLLTGSQISWEQTTVYNYLFKTDLTMK